MTNTNRTAAASARILALIAAGSDPIDALRTVCGATVVDTMITNVYNTLRAGKAA